MDDELTRLLALDYHDVRKALPALLDRVERAEDAVASITSVIDDVPTEHGAQFAIPGHDLDARIDRLLVAWVTSEGRKRRLASAEAERDTLAAQVAALREAVEAAMAGLRRWAVESTVPEHQLLATTLHRELANSLTTAPPLTSTPPPHPAVP